MNKRVRLKDIADETGFSMNTVSLALQRSPLVAQATSQAILKVASKLNYRPNQLARSLVSQQSRTIGLILTNIENPILTRVAQQIQTLLAEKRYVTLFAASNHSIEQEKNAIDVFLGHQVDGMLIYPIRYDQLTHIEDVFHQGTPGVLLSGYAGPTVDSVSLDARAGARMATEHLIELGHRRIALMDNAAVLGNLEKSQGYNLALSEAGIAIMPSLKIDPGGFDANHGFAGMQQLAEMPERPTAIVAANDLLAIGILHWCRDHGIRVPEDLSVVGFDNIDLSEHTQPPLTTVNYDAEYLSRHAVRRLLHMIESEGEVGAPQSELVRPELILRKSTDVPR